MNWIANDRYKVLTSLSGGNMSKVFLCIDYGSKEKQEVVLKTYPHKDDVDLEKILFHREVENLERLEHKNIIGILDKGIDYENKLNYIVIEYFESQTLDKVTIDNFLDYYQKLKIVLDILDALIYAHSKGIIHRDIKPQNILINSGLEIKLIDFGISKIEDSIYKGSTVKMYGTKKYASPEHLRQGDMDSRSDIYSAALVIAEILLGQEIEGNIKETLRKSDLDEVLVEVLIKGLENEVETRLQKMQDLKTVFLEKFKVATDENIGFYGIGLTNGVITKFLNQGIITSHSRYEAAKVIEKDLDEAYISMTLNNSKNDQKEYLVFGRQYQYYCVVDMKTDYIFTVKGVAIPNSINHENRKEQSVQLVGKFKVSNINQELQLKTTFNNIYNLLDDFEELYREKIISTTSEKKYKNTFSKWVKVLDLTKRDLQDSKYSVPYNGFEYDEVTGQFIINLRNDVDEIKFKEDQMLAMTAASNKEKEIKIGYCIEIKEKQLIIQPTKDVFPELFSTMGDISIDKSMVESALSRQSKALKIMQFKENINPRISDVIFNPQKAESVVIEPDIKFLSSLEESQKNAVKKALKAEDIFVLQGPPGTGKTTFIGELVYQIMKTSPESKILISSQSNVAVDHALNKIQSILPEIKMLRIGRKDRLSQGTEQFMVEEQLDKLILLIKLNSNQFIEQLKSKVNLSESILEAYEKITSIDNLKNKNTDINNVIYKKESELFVIRQKYSDLNTLIEDLNNVHAKLELELKSQLDTELSQILLDFKSKYVNLGSRFLRELDELKSISNQKLDIEDELGKLQDEWLNNSITVEELYSELNINGTEDFMEYKTKIEQKISSNKKEYEKFTILDSIQKEWIKRLGANAKFLEILIQRTNIVGATCLGIASQQAFQSMAFDYVIIDEAGRATPPELLVPMVLAKKVILVGDHKQLPPIVDENYERLIKNEEEISLSDLEKSLFEELMENINENCVGHLEEQFRMHKDIGNLISHVFYNGKLLSKAKDEDRNHNFSEFSKGSVVWLTTINNPNKFQQEIKKKDHKVFSNPTEIQIIFDYIVKMDNEYRSKGIKKEIGIITGYQAQKILLNKKFETEYKNRFTNVTVEINTVDAFQGRETDIIFYSIVRSNPRGNIGFLKDARRLNVALSRAKELLVIVGDHGTVTQEKLMDNDAINPFNSVYEFMQNNIGLYQFVEV
ncbi:AAA domain-containing protein [Lysinibacillus boronitolerans]|uniref:AAA domain-containing protein n=1 Tax=Lysinibacillus boronitolerans TaxID=309788 RepID=UPI00289C43F0|nr:AAA domain-containing protein [Lysinibacillus boronitolerans]